MSFGGGGGGASKWLGKVSQLGQKALDKLDGGSGAQGHNQTYYPQQQQQQQQSYPQAPFQAPPPTSQMQQDGNPQPSQKLHVAYFTNWSIYDRKYHPSKVPAQNLTHILYSFADVRENGEVFLTDKWSDVEIHHDGESWEDGGQKLLYGNFKQFLRMKQHNRQLKLLLSIGGWSFSSHFAKPMRDPQARQTFVQSAMRILEDVGLDGLDIDWEYPKDAQEAHAYVELLRELRSALDARARHFNVRHWLSIAAPCGEQMHTLHVAQMDPYLDMWNLMAYDFSGTWSDRTAHQANLFDPPGGRCDSSVQRAVDFYRGQGVAPYKLIIGMPLYARAFAHTRGLNQPFKGVPEGGAEPGNFFYADLPLAGHVEQFDAQACATFSHCAGKNGGEWASYEGPQSVDAKCAFIQQNGLGGAMWWELSGDMPADHERALIPRTAYRLGALDSTPNSLQYPHSQYDNVRSGQPL